MNLLKKLATISLLTLGVGSVFPWTLHGAEVDLTSLSQQADFVFMGTVEKIEYRMSNAPSKSFAKLPHTFVTFKLDNIFKGRAAENKITLRFLGGPDRGTQVMIPENSPLFNPGNTQLLFVENNTLHSCPLVGCGNGRFSIVNGLVYDDDGRELLTSEDGKLYAGEIKNISELNSHRINGALVKKISSPEVGESLSATETKNLRPLNLSQLALTLEKTIAKEAKTTQLVRSANIQDDFFLKAASALQPPRSFAAQPAVRAPTDQEKLEAELFEENNHNPVLLSR